MWNLKIIDTNKSLYIALADALERDIRTGVLQPGDRLPSHRELARSVGVTVTAVTGFGRNRGDYRWHAARPALHIFNPV